MSVERYNRLVEYLNSPERVTLWEHRRLSQPYLWGRDEPREPVRSITGLAMRTAKLFKVNGAWASPGRAPVESDVLKASRMIYIARGLSSGREADDLSPFPVALVREFFQRWTIRSYTPYWQDTVDVAIHRYAQRSTEVKRFRTLGAFYAELWHRLKSTFALHDAPTCEFEDLPLEFSAMIRTDAPTNAPTLRLATNRSNGERGSMTLRFGAIQHEVFAQASEGWSTIDIPLQGQGLDVEIIDEGPVAGFTHIEEHGFEVD